MNLKKLSKKNLIFLIIIIIIILFFYPKPYIKGGLAGLVGEGQTAYKEEFKCFGFKHSYYPKGCLDCGNIYNCYGITYGKKCYTEVATQGTTSQSPTECK
jgi:hypothetical protein